MTSTNNRSFSLGTFNWKSVGALGLFAFAVFAFTFFELDGKSSSMALLIAAGVFGLILFQLSAAKAKIADEQLIVGGGIYKVKIPWTDVEADQATVLDPNDSFRIGWRKNGIGWPGCSLGWFTSNGNKDVFAATSGRSNRVYIPTKRKYDIVITPDNPIEFIKRLKVH